MDDQQLSRYSRHLLLPEVDIPGQTRLLSSTVLVTGLGGLGSPVVTYLAASGVGTLRLNDPDRVDLSNLQRQTLYGTEDMGRLKTDAANDAVRRLNPDIQTHTLPFALQGLSLQDQVAASNVVVDCSDNFSTRYLLNAACLAARVPLVSGAAIRLEGQVVVFRFDLETGPCYQCLYPPLSEEGESCAQSGILAPVAGFIGCLQAIETLKILLGLDSSSRGRMIRWNAQDMTWRSSRLPRDPECALCGPQHIFLESAALTR